MLECSVYGILIKKLNKGVKFTRTEQVYSDGTRTGYVVKNIVDGEIKEEIIIKEIPDRNKQRISIVQKIIKFDSSNNAALLKTIGFEPISYNRVEGYLYYRNGYKIEISRLRPAEETVDSSEENNFGNNEIPKDFLKYYLVKVFLETEDINEGEMLIEKALQDLNGEVELIKPSLHVF